ncbi:MAG: HDOD domain-containing protein [Gammaproteobacteria bacterium]|nr:HDOD domain-containing protein [Gammaproteobacteria bacterium]
MHGNPITLESLLAQGPELSSPPEVYLKVNEQLEDDFCSARDIGETVQSDPAITTRILKMVNSAYYGMPNRVSTISQAVSLLGRDRLKQIIIGTVLASVFKDPEVESFSLSGFWQHSIKTAIIARQLAIQHNGDYEPDALFIAGLLHDIGRVILVNRLPEIFTEIEQNRRKRGLIGAEMDLLGFSHAELGGALMAQWSLPDMLTICTRYHHDFDYSGQFTDACRIIYMANKLSHNVPPLDEDEANEQLDEIENWQLLGVPLEQICYASQYSEDELLEIMESFGMINLEVSEG